MLRGWAQAAPRLAEAAEESLLRRVDAAAFTGREDVEVEVARFEVAVPFAGQGGLSGEFNVHTLNAYVPEGGSAAAAVGVDRVAEIRSARAGRYGNRQQVARGTDEVPVVMVHGFGAGAAMFYLNLGDMARGKKRHHNVFAIDMVGCGLSERPRYSAADREEAEELHVQSIEGWRKAHGFDKIDLVGHSMGGYMSARYALKHPERVRSLVLVSPVGVPEADMEASGRTVQRSFASRGIDVDHMSVWDTVRYYSRSAFIWTATRLVRALWAAGVTPQGIVRLLGPWGPDLIEGYVKMRFSDHVDKQAFGHYLYQILAARGSGEYALNRVLHPGAFAKAPLCRELSHLKMPMTALYGDHDWMDFRHMRDLPMTLSMRLEVIRDSGHFLFTDNPVDFNEALIRAIESPPPCP